MTVSLLGPAVVVGAAGGVAAADDAAAGAAAADVAEAGAEPRLAELPSVSSESGSGERPARPGSGTFWPLSLPRTATPPAQRSRGP